eukprot:g5767.t1
MPQRASQQFGDPCHELCRSEKLYDLSAYNLNPLQPNKEQVIAECAQCQVSTVPGGCVDECPRPGRAILDCFQNIKLIGNVGESFLEMETDAKSLHKEGNENIWVHAVNPSKESKVPLEFEFNVKSGKWRSLNDKETIQDNIN